MTDPATSLDGPLLTVFDSEHRTLLSLDVVDDMLVAAYDPADLDQAAAAFVEQILQAARSHRWVFGEGPIATS